MEEAIDPHTLMIIGLSVGLGSAAVSAVLVVIILCCRGRCHRKGLSDSRRQLNDELGRSPTPDPLDSTPPSRPDIKRQDSEIVTEMPSPYDPDEHTIAVHRTTATSPHTDSIYSVSKVEEDRATSLENSVESTAEADHTEYPVVKLHRNEDTFIERQLTFPPVLMVPFRTMLLSGRSLLNRPSTIAGLPTFHQNRTSWDLAHQSDEAGPRGPVYRRASNAAQLRARETQLGPIHLSLSKKNAQRSISIQDFKSSAEEFVTTYTERQRSGDG